MRAPADPGKRGALAQPLLVPVEAAVSREVGQPGHTGPERNGDAGGCKGGEYAVKFRVERPQRRVALVEGEVASPRQFVAQAGGVRPVAAEPDAEPVGAKEFQGSPRPLGSGNAEFCHDCYLTRREEHAQER